jgi:hypothetical protein
MTESNTRTEDLGDEGQGDPPHFEYSATLRIFGEGLDLDAITRGMRLEPTYRHHKGDRRGPRSPKLEHDMWQLGSGLPEDRPLGDHIDALWGLIRPSRDFLLSLKQSATVDVFLGYRSSLDTAGVEVPHTCLEMFTSLEIPFGLSIIVA